MRRRLISCGLLAAVAGLLACAQPVRASLYNVSYTDGGTYNSVYVQGFSTSLGATPAPSVAVGSTVNLSQFQFFKSGNTDNNSNIELGIFNTMYPNTVGLSTSSSSFVGLSSNTINGTSSYATGSPLSFTFNNLALTYGSDYSAIFVTNDGAGNLTPVLVPVLTANYAQQPDGNYHPVTNYGTESQYQYTTSNYISGGYFSAFSYAGDADFSASLSTPAVPEPATISVALLGSFGLARRRSRAVTV